MPTQNDSRLYSGGAVVFDSSPSVNLYGQLLQRRQAKNDALDEYDRQRINSINDTGVRDRDREGFDRRLQEIREYYGQNKDKVRKANTPEAYEYEKMFRGVRSYINASKERTAKQDAAIKLRKEVFGPDGIIPDDYITDLEANDRGIDEEGSASFDLNKYLGKAKPYDRAKSNRAYSVIKRTPGTPFTEPIEGNKYRVNEVTEEKYDDKSLEQIQFMAANDFENSGGFREEVRKDVEDPVKRVQLANVFKQLRGTEPASMDDYAFAYKMQELQPTIRKTRQIENKDATMTRRENFAREIQGRIDSRSFGLANLRREWQILDQTAQDEYLDEVYNAYERTSKVDPQIVSDYEKKDAKGHPVPIEETRFNKDGSVDFIVRDPKTGEIDKDWSTLGVPKSQIKARARKELETQMTNTGQQKQPTGKQGTYNIKGKSYTEAQLLKMGYTKDQIAPYRQK